MMPTKIYKKIETIVSYFVINKNLGVSFQNGPEHETTFLKNSFMLLHIRKYKHYARFRNAEELEQLNRRITEELQRQKKAEAESQRIQEMINQIIQTLWKFCDMLKVSSKFYCLFEKRCLIRLLK